MQSNEIKYFLYVRRSMEKKDGEEKVASIDSQLTEMKRLAETEGLKVVQIFHETKSAKKPFVREQFNEMVKQIQQGKANGILVWKIDRLARNPVDEGTIKYMLQEGVVKHIRAHDRSWHSDDHSLLASVEFGTATQYSRDLSKHVKRGLKSLAESGYRPNMAPIGYKNSKYRMKGKEEILVDEERFPIVRKLFDLMLTGAYTRMDLLKIANEQLGLRMRYNSKHGIRAEKLVTRSNIYHVLTNPFYYGEFRYSGEWYQGNHKPMITKEEYDKIQRLLGRDGRPRPKTHHFPYTGLIKCEECGASITASMKVKRQKNGNVHFYTYYYCTRRKDPNCTQRIAITEKNLEEQIMDFLKKIEVPKLFHEWAIDTLKEMHEVETKDRNKLLYQKQTRYTDITEKLDTLVNLLMDGAITREVYDEKKASLERERGNLKVFLNDIDARIGAWMKKVEEAFDFALDARKEFEAGDMEKKRLILSTIGWNHLLKDRKLILRAEKPLLVIQEAASEAKSISDQLEPPKNKALQRRIQEKYSRNPVLCPGQDLHLHRIAPIGTSSLRVY